MAKQIIFAEEARTKLQSGVKQLANSVRVTIWPKGRDVVLDKKYWGPTITNDGVTIVKEIELEDKFENLWVQMVKEASTKTNDTAWDWTTTAIILADAIIEEGIKNIIAGANPMVMKMWIQQAINIANSTLNKMAKQIDTQEEIAQVATISAQDKEVGQLISEVIEIIWTDGVITVEDGNTTWLTKEVVEWMQFDNGYISPYMITNPQRMEAVFENASILITDQKVSSLQPLLPLLEGFSKQGKKDIVIIADDIDGDALTTIVMNKIRGSFNILAVKAPGFWDRRKEMLQDLAILTGWTVISEEVGLKLENAQVEHLGHCAKLVSTKDQTIIIDGKGNKSWIDSRVEQIKQEINNASSEYNKEKLAERLAKLAWGIAVIKVWAASEIEQKEKKMRIEDALAATKAAISEGVVAGWGSALISVSKTINIEILNEKDADIKNWMITIANACNAPLKQIAENSWFSWEVVLNKVIESVKDNEHYWFDASRNINEKIIIEDLFKKWIIDPKQVVRTALENAASVAWTFLTTEAAITNTETKDEPTTPAMPMWMPWMM